MCRCRLENKFVSRDNRSVARMRFAHFPADRPNATCLKGYALKPVAFGHGSEQNFENLEVDRPNAACLKGYALEPVEFGHGSEQNFKKS